MLTNADGDIVRIGSEDQLRAEVRDNAKYTDLRGHYCLPGLIDAHAHMIMGGISLGYLDLGDVASREDFVRSVGAAARGLEPGDWLVGFNYDERKFADGAGQPRADWIDGVTPNNPVFLSRSDGHTALVNGRALDLARITETIADPPGGEIERDGGEPTGILRDAAITLVKSLQPRLRKEERKDAIKAAVEYALSNGVTSVHDMGTPIFSQSLEDCMTDLTEVWYELAEEEELKIRVMACVPLAGEEGLHAFVTDQGTRHHHSQMLHWGCVKEFYDGSLGSETALMHEPYLGTQSTGLRIHETKDLEERVARANSNRHQIIVHAIGDRAVDEAAAILKKGAPALGAHDRPRRHRLEHVQHVAGQGTLRSLLDDDITVVANPLHIADDVPAMEEKLGRERGGKGRSYPFRSMSDVGLRPSFGSDWPLVAPLDPLGSIMAATTERAHAPEEALTREEGLLAVTARPAEAAFMEDLVGQLKPGMKADFVVLDRDVTTSKERPKVLRTFVNGNLVYKKKKPV